MIDEKLDERIQKFAQSTRLNDAGRRAGFEGYQPTQSMADRQSDAPPVKQNVQAPPASIRPTAPTSMATSEFRHDGSAPRSRVDPSQVKPRMNIPNLLVKGPDGKSTLASNSQLDDNKPAVRLEDLPSSQMMKAINGEKTDIEGAAKRAEGYWQPETITRLQDVQRRASAARSLREKNRATEEAQAKRNLADAFSLAVDAWQKAEPTNGRNNDGTPSENRYKVGALEPETIRELNGMIAPIVGLRKGEKIVGLYAVTPVDANGEYSGGPQIVVRWRRGNSAIRQQAIPYREAAQYVRDSMGARDDKEADFNFVMTRGHIWSDRTHGQNSTLAASGNYLEYDDELGLSRTSHVLDRIFSAEGKRREIRQMDQKKELADRADKSAEKETDGGGSMKETIGALAQMQNYLDNNGSGMSEEAQQQMRQAIAAGYAGLAAKFLPQQPAAPREQGGQDGTDTALPEGMKEGDETEHNGKTYVLGYKDGRPTWLLKKNGGDK